MADETSSSSIIDDTIPVNVLPSWSQNPDSGSETEQPIVINPNIMSDVRRDIEILLSSLSRNDEAQLPASQQSIDDMPTVIVTETGRDCAICLEDFEIGGEGKMMPCQHRFHSTCIESWLCVRGTCPVCRFKMPVADEVINNGSFGFSIGFSAGSAYESRPRTIPSRDLNRNLGFG